nr:hypothetical protein [Tanacetum cinerariifolium]
MEKVKTINDEVRIQALIDEKRVNIKESSILRTLKLDDAESTSCLANAEIFNGFAKMGYEKLSEKLTLFVQLLIDHQLGDMSHHKDIYDNPFLTKKVFANMKKIGAGFFRVVTLLFDNMLVLAAKEVGSLGDKIICDLDKTPDFFQRSPQNCLKCGHPVNGHYCQGCALLRKKFKEDLFTYGIEHGIFQDSSEPSNDNTNVVNAPREPFVVNQDPGKNSSQSHPQINHHCCYGCGDLLEADLVHNSPNVFDPPPQLPFISCEFCGNDARYGHYYTPQVPFVYPEPCYNQDFNFLQELQDFYDFQQQDLCSENCEILTCYDDDDDDYAFAITPNEPVNSLSMGDEHLDTISVTESDEFIKFSVENLFPIPSESKGKSKCDVPAYEEFTTFSNILFDAEYDFYSSDDQSFYDEDVLKKIFSNPLFDEEIIPMKIDPQHYNVESDLIESLCTHDSSIIISSKIDSLFDEFAGELTLLKSIPPRIDETDCDPEEEIRLIERFLYDNSSPRPPGEFVSENSNAEIKSFSPSPIPIEDSDSLMKEIDLSFTPDYPMPLGIEDDDDDSERDILILKDLLCNDTLSLPEKESFHFDIPSFSRPPAKPPDGNTGILNVKIMVDISKQKVPMPKFMITLVPNQDKSHDLLAHQGLKAFQPSAECPMMIHGKNTPILDVPLFHFYPP